MDDTGYGEKIAEESIRFERLLPGPIERVWAFLTESDKRGQWLAPAPWSRVQAAPSRCTSTIAN